MEIKSRKIRKRNCRMRRRRCGRRKVNYYTFHLIFVLFISYFYLSFVFFLYFNGSFKQRRQENNIYVEEYDVECLCDALVFACASVFEFWPNFFLITLILNNITIRIYISHKKNYFKYFFLHIESRPDWSWS